MRGFLIYFLLALSACATQTVQPRGDWKAYHDLGVSYLARGDFSQAIIELNRALAINDKEPEIYHNLGWAYWGREEYDRAISYFKRSLELNPKFSEARNSLGLIYIKLGRFQEAVYEFDLALADPLYPFPERLYANRGLARMYLGNKEEAIRDLKRAVDIMPSFMDARYILGKLLLERDRVEEAVKELEFALKLAPSNLDVRYNLAMAYIKGNNKGAAIKHLKEIVKAAPDSQIGKLAASQLSLLEGR